jgi:hypothetical protein
MKTCFCGSGEQRRPIYDGYGIFLTNVCDKCERAKLKEFRQDIFTRYECDEQIEAE